MHSERMGEAGKLVSDAGMNSDEDLKDSISTISDKCKICEVYCRLGFQPAVSVSLVEDFN